MPLRIRLLLALAAYAAIALAAWKTIDEIRLRAFVWVVMGFFAVKSLLHWYRTSHMDNGGRE